MRRAAHYEPSFIAGYRAVSFSTIRVSRERAVSTRGDLQGLVRASPEGEGEKQWSLRALHGLHGLWSKRTWSRACCHAIDCQTRSHKNSVSSLGSSRLRLYRPQPLRPSAPLWLQLLGGSGYIPGVPKPWTWGAWRVFENYFNNSSVKLYF